MSDATREALEAALEAHIRDFSGEDDAVLTGYVIQVCSSNINDLAKNWYGRFTPTYQPWHSSLGLVEHLARSYDGSDDD